MARLHPGGTIGRGLIRVAELMHQREEVPLVTESAPLSTVIREMSAKRLGCTGVVDAAGRLTGIVTDGDLRRAVERGGDQLPATAAAVMTHRPKTVGRAELAVTALELMERHSITQLFIVDDEGRPDGVLHLHDLLRAKVA
jgi:arabinose-5-phosphate isomerase